MRTSHLITQKADASDFYSVETRAGEREWLAIPTGTPVRIVRTPKRPRPAVAAVA